MMPAADGHNVLLRALILLRLITLPGILNIKTVKKPARKAQKNVPNPFRPG